MATMTLIVDAYHINVWGFWDSNERQVLSATEPRGSARQPHTLRNPVSSAGTAAPRVPDSSSRPPREESPPPQLSGAEPGERAGPFCPLLAGLDLSALIREPLRAQSPPSRSEGSAQAFRKHMFISGSVHEHEKWPLSLQGLISSPSTLLANSLHICLSL